MKAIPEVSHPEFQKVIVEEKKPVIAAFFARSCIPCARINSLLREISDEFPNKLAVVRLDIEKYPAAASTYKITGAPTVLCFVNGHIWFRLVGPVAKKDLLRMVYEGCPSQKSKTRMVINAPKDYKIFEEIGRSHMSRIYRAIHQPTANVVALKVFLPDVLSGKRGWAQFYSEARFHCPLKHDNILRCQDFFVENGLGYLAMEYIDGFNLRHCIEEGLSSFSDERMRLSHMVDTALRISEGLIYLHAQKIFHGHINPENILVSREVCGSAQTHMRVKLSDFTMAGPIKKIFRPSCYVKGGTPRYMAPEQISRRRTSLRSDIFSLGVIFYELFTGHYPWNTGGGRRDFLSKLLSPEHRPSSPSELMEYIPPRLDKLIMAMIEKKEKNRPSSMAEVWSSLSTSGAMRI